MKRDFKQSRPDKWSEKSRSQPERSEYNNEVHCFVGSKNLMSFLVDTSLWSLLQLFVEYYKKQGVVPEGEWDHFMEVLRMPLPTTFRINGTGKFATDLRDKLESDFLSNFNQDPIMVCVATAFESPYSQHRMFCFSQHALLCQLIIQCSSCTGGWRDSEAPQTSTLV